MRQRLQKFLPIILIALLAQILAPVAACWAAAYAISDPLGFGEICHSDSTSQGAAGSQGDQGADHCMDGSACQICCAAQANASFDAPQDITFAAPYRQFAQVIWHARAQDIVAFRAGLNAQARAPPVMSI